MKVAIDSSIIFAILKGESDQKRWMDLIVRLRSAGISLVVCEAVWAEISQLYSDELQLVHDLEDLGIEFEALNTSSAFLAGKIFGLYLKRRGPGPRTRVVADFLIGAHASRQAGGLISRDSGFLRSYFHDLKLVDPDDAV